MVLFISSNYYYSNNIIIIHILLLFKLLLLLSSVVVYNNNNVQGFSSSSSSSSSSYYLTGQTTKNVATQILQGTGPVSLTDLNKYNIPMERIVTEWIVTKVLKMNEIQSKIKLGCKSDKELYVDTIQVEFPRFNNSGLGIELMELVGSSSSSDSNNNNKKNKNDDERNNGLGITIVSGLVDGGAASTAMNTNNDSNMIMIGDSISSVTLIRRKRSSSSSTQTVQEEYNEQNQQQQQQQQQTNFVQEQEEIFPVSLECLNFDSTVKALQEGIPSPLSGNDDDDLEYYYKDLFRIVLKRIRRKPKVTIKLQYPPSQKDAVDTTIELYAGENLRQGMLIRNVQLNDIYAKRFDTKSSGNCGAGGLCRTCAVSIIHGKELLNEQRVAEKQMLAVENPRWRLACKAIVGYGMKEGEMTIRVNPRQW